MANINPVLTVFLVLLAGQRIAELSIAKRNTDRMLARGGVEFGRSHYWLLVALHAGFFFSLCLEAALRGTNWTVWSALLLPVFLLTQLGRVWVIRTMGDRWSTRIFVIPGEASVARGPFRFVTHPNYIIVAIEIAIIPMIFGLYWTALIFTVLNAAILLGVRIPEENRALAWATGKR